jgi:hypothetical protein
MRKLFLMASWIVLVAISLQAETVYTWDGSASTWQQLSDGSSANAVTQRFTVPEGKVCTKVEMWAEKHGSWYQTSGYYTHIAVYAVGSYSTPIAMKSYEWTDPYWNDVTGAYLTASNSDLSLSAGTYEVQIWCNSAMACSRCFAPLYTASTYSGGYAEAGWAGTASMGDTCDFAVRLTFEEYTWNPEVASMGWYDDRWGDACDTTASAIVAENASVVLPYLSGVNFASYQSHVNACGGAGLKLIFEFNRYDVNTSNTSAITSLVQSFTSHPGVYGWYTADEPHGNSTALAPLVTAYTTIKANSGKPVMIAFNAEDLLFQTPITYASAYDIMMMDYYPFSSGSSLYSGMAGWKTFISTSATQAATAGKEWWSIIQAYGKTSGYSLDFTMRLPTYTEANFMTFWSVLQGAKGVMLWSRTPCLYSIAQSSAPYIYDGDTWAENVGKPIMDVFKACGAAIHDGAVANGVTDNNTNVVSALYEDTATAEYFLIAANSTTGTQSNVQFTLTLPAGYVNAIPLGENRDAITLSSGAFTDSFGDYGVHVYRLMPDEQVINTYSGSGTSYWAIGSGTETSAAVQWFTVPEGTKGTKFEFMAEIGSAYSSGYHCNVQIYSANGTYIATGSKTADQFEFSSEWVAVENLSLAPGRYYAQMFTNDVGFKGYLNAIAVYPSTYAGGHAAIGWSGGTALIDGKDFECRLTVVQNATATTITGDFNGDGLVNATDIDLLSAAIKTTNPDSKFDLTGEGSVNSADMDMLVKDILKTYYGDADLNHSVGVSDLSVLAAYYNTPSGASWANGDFDGNGAVGVSDLSILAANYNSGSASTISWAEAYAQAFGTTSDADETTDASADDSEDTTSSVCSSLGLSLIAGLALMGLMMVKLEE